MSTILTWEDDAGATVSVIFDCDMQQAHAFANEITDHPVEEGADITDHVRRQLNRYTVEGYVTDSPTISNPDVVNQAAFEQVELQIPTKDFQPSVSAVIGAAVTAVGDALFGGPAPLKATMLRFENFESRKRAALEILEEALKSARLVRVITSMKEYDNMLINTLDVTRTPDDGTGATFVVGLREIEQVSSDIVIAPEPAELLGAVAKAAGVKSASNDKEKIAEIKKSILARGADSLGDLGAALF